MNRRETGEADKATRQDAGSVGQTGTKEERGGGGDQKAERRAMVRWYIREVKDACFPNPLIF